MARPNLDEAYLSDLSREHELVELETELSFLKEHKGIHYGKMHLLLGTTSTGKSGITRMIVEDLLKNNTGIKIVLWQSEESLEDFEISISKTGLNLNGNTLDIYSEYESLSEAKKKFWEVLSSGEVFIYDNITTSSIYGSSFEKQEEFSLKLKEKLSAGHIAGFIVAHTNNIMDGSGRFIELTDLRGCKTIGNIAEFAYILQRYEIGNSKFQTIRLVKHRGFVVKAPFHLCLFNKQTGKYTHTQEIEIAKIKEMNRGRNKL